MAEAILEKIPAEKHWEIATKTLTGACEGYALVLRARSLPFVKGVTRWF